MTTDILSGGAEELALSRYGIKNKPATAKVDSYTLVLADAGRVVELTKGSAVTLTVPPNVAEGFAVGDEITLYQGGAGQVTVAAGAGVTIRSPDTKLKLAFQYSTAVLRQRAANEWVLSGDLAA